MFIPSLQTSGGVSVRQAGRRDLDAIGDLWIELMALHAEFDSRFGVPPQGRLNYIRHVSHALRDPNYHVLVAETGVRVIGYIMGYIAQNPPTFMQSRFGFIADLCVTNAARRHGAGTLLVQSIRQWFRERELDSVQLNVAHHNPISQSFWRKMGCTDYLDHMWMQLK